MNGIFTDDLEHGGPLPQSKCLVALLSIIVFRQFSAQRFKYENILLHICVKKTNNVFL